VGVSILLIRKDLAGKKYNQIIQTEQDSSEKYLDECLITEEMKTQRIVGIDPNKGDIIYCSDATGESMRYSVNQRRVETRTGKYRKIIDRDQKTTLIENDKTVKQLEAELSQYNSKTCDYNRFVAYLKAKNQLNQQLFSYYQKPLFRKLKLNTYINTQRSEDQLINRFKAKYGAPSDVLIAFGDHEQKKQMKFHYPTKDKGMRTLFRRHGYVVYLINEHRTSCRCYKCEQPLEEFLKRENPRPWRRLSRPIVKVHGLLRCQTVTCRTVYNRDYNACQNMIKIAQSTLDGLGRPPELSRESVPIDQQITLISADELISN
jgi:transposase